VSVLDPVGPARVPVVGPKLRPAHERIVLSKRFRFGVTLAASIAVLALDANTPRGLATWLLQIAVVWTALPWTSRNQIIGIAGWCSFCIVLGFLLSARSCLPISIAGANIFLGVVAILLLVNVNLEQRAEQAARRKAEVALEASRAEVRVLSGLLPICASCKRIRNDAGQWEQMEVYISQHSEAGFTHGVCPACITKMFPEDDDENLS
jgi:hypothetical protein